MKTTTIKINKENIDTVVKKLKDLVQSQHSDQLVLLRWLEEQFEMLEGGMNNHSKLRALDYIREHQKLMLCMVDCGPTYVRFCAETNISCLLEYGSELIEPNHFVKSYHEAFRKLQKTFKSRGYEFSEVIFTSVEDGGIAIIWETNKPVSFQNILDYPKSLFALATLLDELNIDGLEFGYSYHLIGPLSNKDEECLDGQVFKQGVFNEYGDSHDHLVQECPFDFGGFIHYQLDGSYHLELDEKIEEESLEMMVQSGYHLDGHHLRGGLNGVIKSVGVLNW